MLYTQTVKPSTLELLKCLMHDGNLPAFRLVGGTALALLIGHRVSVDLDLFVDSTFDEMKLREYLEHNYDLKTEYQDKETLKGEIDGVQIDCIAHKYPWIRPELCDEGIRIASKEDICAMKLNAIVGNGSRVKDFIDVAYLTETYSFNQMLGFYEEKYHASRMMPMKAVVYFDDVNVMEPVKMVGENPLNWKQVSNRLIAAQAYPDKIGGKIKN